MINEDCGCGGHKKKPTHMAPKKQKVKAFLIKLMNERISNVDGEWVVYPKKGGNRLGTHSSKKGALKQLAAIEINKKK
tara:strand:- start:377 stop:610 length:234 start_codon:yes stop_codon:yes gene_type:complete